eukprot:COSAG03_NODE_660_length_6398_cov_33.212415_6_plen_138_part_00
MLRAPCGRKECTARGDADAARPFRLLPARASASGTVRRAPNQHATSPHSRIEQLLRAQGGGERVAGALLEAGRKQDTRSHAEQRRLEAPGSRESGRHQQQLGKEVAVSRPPGSCGLKLRYSWRLSGGFEAVRAARCP